MLFPFIPETKKWSKKGRNWLEQELDYQIYEDGTFLQFSMNYNRVLVQLLSIGIAISEKNNQPFSKNVYSKAYKTVNFLFQCMQNENGFLPNYGANDGALFFPLTDSEYRDYRPQLNTLHQLLTGENLFGNKEIQEDSFWVHNNKSSKQYFSKLNQEKGTIAFDKGGYYICRTDHSFTFVRCGNHQDRPSHADNLHMDVWVTGTNILRDSGTYKYNTDKEIVDYFTGTKGHNTVCVDNQSQMLKGNRFIWFYWTQSRAAKWTEDNDYFIFNGSISAFRYLNNKVVHNRTIKIAKNRNQWIVKDEVLHLDNYTKKQLWHFDDTLVTFSSLENNYSNDLSFNSSFYGQKVAGKAIAISFKKEVETKIEYTL